VGVRDAVHGTDPPVGRERVRNGMTRLLSRKAT
jgi:hypothetical protein